MDSNKINSFGFSTTYFDFSYVINNEKKPEIQKKDRIKPRFIIGIV